MGLRNVVFPSAATLCRAKKLSPSRPASATPPNPPPTSQRNSRRVRPQNCREELSALMGHVSHSGPPHAALLQSAKPHAVRGSIEINKLVHVQRQQAVSPQRIVALHRADELNVL